MLHDSAALSFYCSTQLKEPDSFYCMVRSFPAEREPGERFRLGAELEGSSERNSSPSSSDLEKVSLPGDSEPGCYLI